MTAGSFICTLIPVGGFLFLYWYFYTAVEVDNVCWAKDGDNTPVPAETAGATDVNANFSLLLLFFGILQAIEVLKLVLAYGAVLCKSQFLLKLYNLLRISGLAQLVAYIMMLVYRLRHAGRVCSGSFLEENAIVSYDDYLMTRGKLFWVLILISWIFLGIACLACIIFAVVAAKK